MSSSLVSVIIPTYNRAHLILETLNSIKVQTYTNWECIVVDDGSTDETKDVLTIFCLKDARFQYHHRPDSRPKGANSCRNYGFEFSNGDYINWFDSDDVMHKDKLQVQVLALENSKFNFSVCQTLVFENSIKNIIGLRHEIIYSDTSFEDYLALKIVWMTPSAMWKKHFLLVYIRRHFDSISYNNDTEKRELNYLLAREKVFNFLKEKKIKNNYLINYFITHYKYYLKKRYFSIAFKILKNHLLFYKDLIFYYKIKLTIAYCLYVIFNKGEFIFKGKRFKDD